MLVAPLVALATLAVVMAPPAAFALGTTSTAPTPPDLFVAYAPLVSQGNTPGADTVQAYDTSTLATLATPSSGASASLGSAQVGAQPIAEAVSPDGGTAYVLNSASDTITPVNTLASPPQVETTIPLPTGYTPTAIAITPDGQDAYVTGYPSITNSLTPALWEIELAGNSPGTLARTILLPANSSPAGLALTADGVTALVTNYSGGDVIPVTLKSGLVGSPITVGAGPLGIQVSGAGANADAYVANSEDGTISQIALFDDTAATPSTELEVGFLPQQVAVSPDGTTLWVSEDNQSVPGNAGFVVPVSIPSMTVGSPIAVGDDPNGVAISPDGSTVYVADETNAYLAHTQGEITMIDTASDTASYFYTAVDPAAVLVTPDEAPVAAFTSSPAPAGQTTCFDASGSYSLTTGGLSYTWNFGDGTVSPPATSLDDFNRTTCHPYRLPGTYTVTLAVSDASGTSTSVVYNGQYVLNNGGPSAGQSSAVVIPAATIDAPPVAYVTNSHSNTVTPILAVPSDAIAANDAGSPIPVGVHPDAIAITPNGTTAYVANFGSDNVTPIDVATNIAAPTGGWIPVGSEPDAIAITPDGSTALVANSGDGTVSKIALSTRQVVATITVGGSPSGIAISPDGSTAYVSDNAPGYNNLIPINLTNDAVEPSIPAGTDPLAVAITPDGSTAFVVDRGSNIVPGAVTPVNLTTYPASAASAIAVGNAPDAIAISPDGSDVYVANSADGTVSQIALSADVPGAVTTSNAGTDPAGIAVTPDSQTAYVADDQPGLSTFVGSVSELGLPTAGGVPTPIAVQSGPDAIAITPDQAPVASLKVVPAPSGSASAFDASQSTFPSSPGASYTWSFGDGSADQTTTVPTTTHVYAEGGDYTASVTVTDLDGTSTTQAFTGQTVSLNGGPSAQASQSVDIPFVAPSITGVSPSSGDAGQVTSLIVSGTNLFGITSVDVGGVSVSGFTVSSDGTQISGVLAPSTLPAGTVDVTATNPGGTSAITPQDTFTYLATTTPPDGAPTVSALSAHWGPVAGGTGVTITGTNLAGATSVDFGGTAATTFTVDPSGDSITVLSPPALTAGSLDVTVTTPVATSAISTADAFTYLAPPAPDATPSVSSVSPNEGPTSGLTSVTVTGVNLSGVIAVDFGSAPAESFFSSNSTTLTAVSPAVAVAGTVDITVTTLAGTTAVVPADAFTYEDGTTSAGPVVTSVSPATGPVDGGTTVVITGSNFSSLSASAVAFGATTASSFTVNSAGTKITATSPASAAPVTVDVVVTNPLGSSTITPADTFTYQPDDQFAPTLTSVSPSSGPVAGGGTATLVGANLGLVSQVNFGSTAVTDFTVNGAGDQIFVTIPAAGAAGTVSVTVTNPYGTSAVAAADAYTYLGTLPGSGPLVTAIAPEVGPVAGGTGVEITGTSLSDVSAVYFGTEAASSFTANGAGTEITAVSPAALTAGSVDVTVVADSQTTPIVVADVFTYLNGLAPPGPSISSIAPSAGPLTGGTVVTVTGANLTGALAVDFGATAGTDVTVNPAGTSLTVTAPAALYEGTVVVSVTTSAGQSAPSSVDDYTYQEVASTYTALTPYRLLDTRLPGGGGEFAAGETRSLAVAGVDGVPSGATGVLVNLTVTDNTASTFLTLFPAGTTQPPVSSLTAARGQTVAHLVEVPLGSGGAVSIYNSAGSSHVVVDLEGYFTAGTSATGGYVALKPTTVLNTDAKKGGGPVKAGAARKVTLAGLGGVPKTGAAAVAFLLTSSSTTNASYASVYPAGTPLTVSSNLNWTKGASATNLVVAKLGAGGTVNLANHLGSANFTITVLGYVTGTGSPAAGSFDTPIGPSLLYDSTASGAGGPLVHGVVRALTVGGVAGVPTDATMVVLDLTASATSAASSLTVYAAGTARPSGGDLSWLKGQTNSNLVVVPVGTGGQVDLYNQAGSANVIVTVEGFYQS